MSYFINDHFTTLNDLQKRLEATDLVPSHQPLLDGLAAKKGLLKKAGLKSMADLRVRLKNKNTIASLSDDSGIDLAYLSLLRRVLEGFFPKPRPLKAFDWLDQDVTAKLARAGVKNTQQLYEAVLAGADELAKRVGLKKKALSEFQAVSDLSRIQWVSPTYVRVLVAAGFARVARVAAADPERLYEAVVVANEDGRFYKGKVGLRDIKRLVVAAGYVPLSTMNESMA